MRGTDWMPLRKIALGRATNARSRPLDTSTVTRRSRIDPAVPAAQEVPLGRRRSDHEASGARPPDLPRAEPRPARTRPPRSERVQNRIADRITAFAGSMAFVYIHIVWFACWIGFGVEKYPYGLLTMIVSLEAIFLSAFVMISQNRADAKRQVVADLQWQTVQEEDKQNQQLLDLSNQILDLTKAVNAYAAARAEGT